MERLKLLDLFSGIGGFSLGLERSGGFETVAFCEIAPKCRHLLTHHWPSVPVFPDITTLTGEDVGRVDAICGGFPCQDISLAGRGAGLAGERSGLWREYARLVRELRPSFVIVENVSALLGRGLGEVLGDLAALGYDAWWDCISASAVGAPHRRDRLWIVAYARGQQHQGYGDALRREIASGLSRAALANTSELGQREQADEANTVTTCRNARLEPVRGGQLLADAGSIEGGQRRQLAAQRGRPRETEQVGVGRSREPNERWPVDDPYGRRHGAPEGQVRAGWNGSISAGWWSVEPDVGRVAHGVPARVDRLHGLGNAVVPAIPEMIGRAIIRAMSPQVA